MEENNNMAMNNISEQVPNVNAPDGTINSSMPVQDPNQLVNDISGANVMNANNNVPIPEVANMNTNYNTDTTAGIAEIPAAMPVGEAVAYQTPITDIPPVTEQSVNTYDTNATLEGTATLEQPTTYAENVGNIPVGEITTQDEFVQTDSVTTQPMENISEGTVPPTENVTVEEMPTSNNLEQTDSNVVQVMNNVPTNAVSPVEETTPEMTTANVESMPAMEQAPIVFEEELNAQQRKIEDVIPAFDTSVLEDDVPDELKQKKDAQLLHKVASEVQQEKEQTRRNILFIIELFAILIVAVLVIFPLMLGM